MRAYRGMGVVYNLSNYENSIGIAETKEIFVNLALQHSLQTRTSIFFYHGSKHNET